MALSLTMINDSINSYNKKIAERRAFINNANKLINDASMSSKKLGEASENLSLGLTIGGQSVDGGKLSEMAVNINKNINTLSNAVSLASTEITTFNQKLVSLNAEKQRLIRLERENQDKNNNTNTNTSSNKGYNRMREEIE